MHTKYHRSNQVIPENIILLRIIITITETKCNAYKIS